MQTVGLRKRESHLFTAKGGFKFEVQHPKVIQRPVVPRSGYVLKAQDRGPRAGNPN